jgi:hypothetical protein
MQLLATVPESAVVEQATRSVLKTGRTMTFAVKSISADSEPYRPDAATYDEPFDLPEAPF